MGPETNTTVVGGPSSSCDNSVSSVSLQQQQQQHQKSPRVSLSSNDDDDLLSPLQRMRGKLRAKEERFNNLMKSTTGHVNELSMLKNQLRNLGLALEEKEAEAMTHQRQAPPSPSSATSATPTATSSSPASSSVVVATGLSNGTTRSKALEEIATLKSENQAKTNRIMELESEVALQATNLQQMKKDLDDQLRKIIGYKIDLETHDVNFSNYFQEQQALEEAALQEIFNSGESNNEAIRAIEQKYSCRTQQLISKLLADYADMEQRYKRDLSESTIITERLEAEKNELQSRVLILEQQLSQLPNKKEDENGNTTTTTTNTTTANNNVNVLQHVHPMSATYNRIMQLEKLNMEYSQTIQSLTEQLQKAQDEKAEAIVNCELEVANLKLENEIMVEQVTTLEDVVENLEDEDARAIIIDRLAEIRDDKLTISALNAENQRKEKKYQLLRSNTIDFQVKRASATIDNSFVDESTSSDLLRTASSSSSTTDQQPKPWLEEDDGHSGITAAESETTADLQDKVQELYRMLREKDQELVNQRKKFEVREVTLLEKMKSLESSSSSKDKKGKRNTLRFFL